MFQGFVHPALAFGVGLAAVPLIIHLLNRQRHRPLQWAAMKFVLAAYKRTRRRVQLENLLLLLLRMAAVALLALAVARPFASGDSPLARLTEDRRDVLLVLDASASTGYREDVESVFQRIVGRAQEIARSMDGARGDRLQLLVAADMPRLVSWTAPQKALSVLATMTAPSDESLDLARALGEVRELVEKDAAGTGQSALEVRLLTDLQRRSFESAPRRDEPRDPGDVAQLELGADGSPDAQGTPLLTEQLDALSELGVRVLVEDLGPASSVPPNLSIVSVRPEGAIIGAGIPIEIVVTIQNQGTQARPAERVALAIDGERLPSQRVDVPARGRVEAVFSVQFNETGSHSLEASLDGDRLAVDDTRSHVLSVPPPIRVAVVNGARATRIEEDETGLLMAVLEPPDDDNLPGVGGLSPFDPREITPALLGSPDIDLFAYDVIVLANVASPTFTDDVSTRLEEAGAAGAAVIITAGDRFAALGELSAYNKKLFRADGSGLLPAELLRHDSVASRRDAYWRVADFDGEHPALAFFADDAYRSYLTEIPVYEFLAAEPLPEARVLARLDDEAGSPLLIERPYVDGRVFLWTTTIDIAWTWIPRAGATLVPLVHELVRYAGRRGSVERNLAPGASIRVEVAAFPRNPEVVRPDGSRRPVDGEPIELGSGAKSRWRVPEIGGQDTRVAGLYRLELEGGRAESFAVQIDPDEGALERATPSEINALHPALIALEAGQKGADRDDAANPRSGEIWRWLALAALIGLVLESLWGAWIGYRRRIA